VYPPPRKPRKSLAVGFLEIVGLFILLCILQGLKDDDHHLATSSPWATSTVTLPARPSLEGRYAAIFWREAAHETRAIVFSYANIAIRTAATAPNELLQEAFDLNDPRSIMERLRRDHSLSDLKGPQGTAILEKMVELGTKERTGPFIIHGDVTIEFGPLVNEDALVTRLISQHGDLKAASINVVKGAPRGPPSKSKFEDRPVYTIYIAGRVSKLSGPTQKGRSTLYASIIDLGPSAAQLDKYIADTSEWYTQVKSIIGNGTRVSEDQIWNGQAGKEFTVNVSTYDPARDPFLHGGREPGKDDVYEHPMEHAIP
jgi:hypothetical protein